MSEARRTSHKVIRAEIVRIKGETYGLEFEFDDGYADFAEVGSKETAEFYASVQIGEEIGMGINPLLINAKKAEKSSDVLAQSAVKAPRRNIAVTV
jgi:hypothetical protein